MVVSSRPSTVDGDTGVIDVFAYHQRSKHRLDGYARIFTTENTPWMRMKP